MLGYDTETALMAEAKLAPELSCITYSDGYNSDIVHWTNSYRCARWILEQENTSANGPGFDLAVLWAAHPDLRDLIWEGLVAGRYHDVQTRQKLMDIGAGCYRRVFRRLSGSDKVTKLNYSMSDLHARYFGVHMEKDEWRLRYGELRQYPLEAWPEGARRYATYDAVAASRVHVLQDQYAAQNEKHNLWDEAFQVRAHFALHLMSCWGFATDKRQVERVIGQIDDETPAIAKRLLEKNAAGESLLRDDGGKYVRSEKFAKTRMYAAVGDAGELTDTGYKKVKAGEYSKDAALRAGYIKIDEEWCEVSKDPGLIDYCKYRQNQLLRSKLTSIHQAATYGLPVQTSFEVLMETGRTSSSENKLLTNSMALQNPPRKSIMMKVPDTKNPGKTIEVPALAPDGRPVGGMRECFVARPGCTLIACDYGQAELVSLAQVTYSAFGFSNMRELLNNGKDLHLDFGASMLGINYDEAKANKKRDDIKEHRQIAKCFHGLTEVLTKSGWVRLCDLQQGVEVAAASFSDGGNTHIKWEIPTRLTTRVADELVHLENKNIDLWVTPDHRMASWAEHEKKPLSQVRDVKTGRMIAQGGKQKHTHLVHKTCLPEELNKQRLWPSAGLCKEGLIEVEERWLRLAVAVQADGNYTASKDGTIRLGFTKQRKIERLRDLLSGLQYKETVVGALSVPTFYLKSEVAQKIRALLDSDKTLPWWWLNLSLACREIVVDEAQHWDGHIFKRGRGSYKYSSSIKKNVDVLHALASITNRKAMLSKQDDREVPNYGLSIKDHANTRGENVQTTRHIWGREVFCVTVPSDALLVRHGGKTIVCHQCADFGYPGGLGAASFQSYSRKAWGVILSFERSKQLKADWLRHFPEMKEYFRWISGLCEAAGGRADIQSYMSGRWRGKCYYTQGCNNFFQALTADAAKAALFEVSRHCYTVKSSALYGCRPILFVHDEIITEARNEQAAEAAVAKEKIMVEVYQRYTPDVRITADAHLMNRWSKDAEAAFDERGKLVPWQPPQDEDEKAELDVLMAAE